MAGTDQTPEPGSTVQSEFVQMTPLIDVFNKALYRKTTGQIVLEFTCSYCLYYCLRAL